MWFKGFMGESLCPWTRVFYPSRSGQVFSTERWERSQRDDEEAPTSYKWAAQRFWRGWINLCSQGWFLLLRYIWSCTVLGGVPHQHGSAESCLVSPLARVLVSKLVWVWRRVKTKLSDSERKEHNASRWKALIIKPLKIAGVNNTMSTGN